MESWWHDLGTVALSTELNKRVADGVNDELAGTDWPYSSASEMNSC